MAENSNLQSLTTVDHHIAAEESMHPEATGEFTSLLHDLMLAIRIISREVRRAGVNDILGLTDTINVHGESQQKLDIYSNEIIKKSLIQGGHVCAIATEEDQEITVVGTDKDKKYIILLDPLDGSSNINLNITIGTIFGIYRRQESPLAPFSKSDVLQKGRNLIAGGYALYGSSTVLVYTTGNGVHSFTYDPTIGEFLLSRQNIRIPRRGPYYSVNEGYYPYWDNNIQNFVDFIKTPNDNGYYPMSTRYVGTLIADFHRTLIAGGIFLYPKDKTHPNGKLRLVYEANPLSFVIEQAGGISIDGNQNILDIEPPGIHCRTPLFLGSPDNMADLMKFL
ncbi:MAG TPA: class 1 fructose-bisphosphatase [Candidatus Kapabacteria bacterium]|jgi:fructose-1,6-bisphosphatase I|nr:class 1 fructose-bisphosphatase [Candidatus Kapabacteria bacterium]HOV91607.1 class 1 fructose-bisphosphatase [Candidatus Kapabacteria bacterium]